MCCVPNDNTQYTQHEKFVIVVLFVSSYADVLSVDVLMCCVQGTLCSAAHINNDNNRLLYNHVQNTCVCLMNNIHTCINVCIHTHKHTYNTCTQSNLKT